MNSTAGAAYVLLALAMAVYVGTLAERKGFDRIAWSLGALLFWPGALLMLLLGKQGKSKYHRTCPDCGSTDVPYNTPVCRHCGRDERRAGT